MSIVVEDLLRVVGAVVVAGAGVVAADDEVGGAVVAADDRVQDRLARAGVVHLRRLDAEHHPVVRVVVLHQHLVAAHPHVGGDVAGLGLADQRVDEEPVAGLQRRLGQVLVGAVDRVAGLEGDDPLPAARLEVGLVLGRRLVAAHEGLLVVGQRVDLDRAGDAAAALLVDRGDAGVLLVGGAVDLLGLALDVALEDLLDLDPAQRLAFVAGELDDVADLALEVGRQGDRDRPVLAVGGAHLGADALPVGGALEAGQRREAAVADHLEVGGVALVKGQGKLSHRLAHAVDLTNRSGKGYEGGLARGAAAPLVDPALGLFETRPAAGARRAARPDRLGAVGAADRGVALIVQRVVREVVLMDVVPDVALGPVRERVQLPEPEALVPAELRGLGATAGVLAADAGDPAVDGRERPAHRLDLAHAAAGVGVALPELVAVLGRLLLEGQVVEAVELDPLVLGEAVAGLVGLREEDVGVEVEEARLGLILARHVRGHRARFLERAGDVEALVEGLEHPLERLARRCRPRGSAAIASGVGDLRDRGGGNGVHTAHSPSPRSTL